MADNWISVKDKKPELMKDVLAANAQCGAIRVCYYNGVWHGMISEVTHWQPLPQPPKEAPHE